MPDAGERHDPCAGDLGGEGSAMLNGEHRVGGAVQDQGGGGDLFEPGVGRCVVVEDEVVGHRGSHVPGSIHLLGCEQQVAWLVEPQASRIWPFGLDPIGHHCVPVVPVGFGCGVGERGHHLLTRRWQFTIVVGRDRGAGGGQAQRAHPPGVFEGNALRDAAAHRQPHQVCAFHPQGIQDSQRVGAQIVGGVRRSSGR